MLLDHIERIRRKPPEARRRYAFIVSFVFTGLVALIWFVTLVAGFDSERFGFGQERYSATELEQAGFMEELRDAFSAPEMRFFDDIARSAVQLDPEELNVDNEEEQGEGDTGLEVESGTEETGETSTSIEHEETQKRSNVDTWEDGDSLVPLPTQR
jgi:hypothetical protein